MYLNRQHFISNNIYKYNSNLAIIILLAFHYVETLDNGLARTPPMGWMHWERYRCNTDCDKYPLECINEDLFKRTADLMVSEGYANVGYEYVIIDDCWLEKKRDPTTNKLVADRERFPNGLKALADYIHSKQLKFGLYEDVGSKTCAGYPGVFDYMALDAQTFADWHVDYVKLDGCYTTVDNMKSDYPKFGQLLNETGRPMVYSCSWPAYQEGVFSEYETLKMSCNLWRNWNDIDDSFESVMQIIDYFAKNENNIQPHSGPGHWNDPDMLILGNYGLSYDQSKLQMAVWSVLAAPLLMSTDLSKVRSEIKEILQNRYIIEVDQDSLGIQGKLIMLKNNIEVWTRPIQPKISDDNYSYAVAFVSRRTDGTPYSLTLKVEDFHLNNLNGYMVYDLFNDNQLLGEYQPSSSFETRINPNGTFPVINF